MLKPYYETPLGVLYHGDCLEIMPELEPVDLVLTDMPYNLNFNGITNDNRADYEEWAIGIINNFKKETNNIVLFLGINNLHLTYFIKPDWVACWFKPGSMTVSKCGFNNWQPIYIWGKRRYRGNDVFRAPIVVDKKNEHPTPKPLKLISDLADLYSAEMETVLDPFLGSGTTAVACERLKRKWIGIEIEEKYCEIAAKRIEAERKQLKLF